MRGCSIMLGYIVKSRTSLVLLDYLFYRCDWKRCCFILLPPINRKGYKICLKSENKNKGQLTNSQDIMENSLVQNPCGEPATAKPETNIQQACYSPYGFDHYAGLRWQIQVLTWHAEPTPPPFSSAGLPSLGALS